MNAAQYSEATSKLGPKESLLLDVACLSAMDLADISLWCDDKASTPERKLEAIALLCRRSDEKRRALLVKAGLA